MANSRSSNSHATAGSNGLTVRSGVNATDRADRQKTARASDAGRGPTKDQQGRTADSMIGRSLEGNPANSETDTDRIDQIEIKIAA